MLNLSITTDLIDVILGTAKTIDTMASFEDATVSAGDITKISPDSEDHQRSTAATHTVVASPGASIVRNVRFMSFRNRDASACDLTIRVNRNGTITQLKKLSLGAEEVLVFRDGVWFHYDSTGGVYSTTLPTASDTVVGGIEIADQPEMEAASATDKAVTPGRLQFHPSAAKFWVKCASSTTINASYNVTSVANTATGRQTITIGTDFSSPNWSVTATAEAASNATAVANRRNCCVANAGQAAGTVEINCWDQTATNAALVNPTSWYVQGFGDQ